MRGNSVLEALVAVFVLTAFAVPGSASAVGTAATPDATIAANVIYIVQGESGLVSGHMTANDFFVMHIITFDLPYNVSRVYTQVPRDARNVTVLNIVNATAGWEDPAPSSRYYIDVPGYSVVREGDHLLEFGNASSFTQGATLSGVAYSSGSLHLDGGATSGTYTSGSHVVPNCHTISSGNISIEGNSLSNVSAEVSNDGGTSWVSASTGANYSFPGEGSALRVRLSLTGNATILTNVTGVSLSVKFSLALTPFTVHISYVWSPGFVDRVAAIELTEPLAYSPNGTILLMAYLVKGYVATAEGVDLRFDSNGSLSSFKDKDLYLNMTVLTTTEPTLRLQVTAPERTASYGWLVGAGAAVLLAAVLLAFARRRERPGHTGPAPSAEEMDDTQDEQVETRRRELVARKKTVLERMDALKDGGTEKSMSKADRDAELSSLHKEYKSIRNDLNRLSRAKPSSEPVGSAGSGGTTGLQAEYESSLAAIARLDSDFEARRLPEGAYRSMRKRFVDRAASIKAEMERPGIGTEKAKLMDAIAALDDEHEQGVLEEKTYKDLRASYVKELAEVLRRADQEAGR